VIFAFLNNKANIKKENRCKQYPMPVFAVIYSIVLLILLKPLNALCEDLIEGHVDTSEETTLSAGSVYFALVIFNTLALLIYIIIKKIITTILIKTEVDRNSFLGSVIELCYSYDEADNQWYIREHFGQACSFIKTAYYGVCFISGLVLLGSCVLCMNEMLVSPFHPVFAVIILGDLITSS
jgi:hypothetical protein